MLKKPDFFSISIRNKWKCLLLFHDWFPMKFVFIHIQYFFDRVFLAMPNTKYLLESIKRRSKVQERNMSCECALNFDQWKIFSENYKLMRVWTWLVYNFSENYCHLRFFSEFIQTQKMYSTSVDKIRILTWKLPVA